MEIKNQSYFTSKAYILTQVTQEAIMEFYSGHKIDLGFRYKSCLREDDSPGCSYYYGLSGDILFNDPKLGVFDCFKLIMSKFNISYFDAILKIKMDFKLIKSVSSVLINEEKEPSLKKISIKKREFSAAELEWWQIPGMVINSSMLESHGISSISDLWFNDIYKAANLNHAFAFKQDKPNFYQIYSPLKERQWRFRTNNGSHIYSWNLLDDSDYVILNKSRKDNFYARILGYNSLGIISENFNIPKEKIEYLQSKYKKIYICYDNDEAGLKYTNKIIEKYPFIISRPSLVGKDFTEQVKEKGVDWVRNNW